LNRDDLPPTAALLVAEPSTLELVTTTMAAPSGPSTFEDAAEASATRPLPALRRRLLQVTSPANPATLDAGNPVARVTRRLMVTPWFAVATGLVVAAGVWMYSPHANLQFPNGRGGEQQCKPPACKNTPPSKVIVPNGAARLQIKSSGKIATGPGPREVTFRFLWQAQGKIFVLISVSGSRVPRAWRLAFALPGDQIIGVEGAGWQPSGTDAGVATWPVSHGAWQTVGLGGGGGQFGKDRSYKGGISFVVVATGAPVQPGGCLFNGATCKFSFAGATDGQSATTALQNR